MVRGRLKKILLFLLADIFLVVLAMIVSFLLRFDWEIPLSYHGRIPLYIGISLLITIPLLFWQKLYSFTWSFVSLSEMVELFKAVSSSGIGFTVIYLLLQSSPAFLGFPRSIIFIHYALLFLFLGGLRSAKRIVLLFIPLPQPEGKRKAALVIGAGERADELIRALKKTGNGYDLVGILDNDQEKHSTLLHGVKVLGPIEKLPSLIKLRAVQTIIIALSDNERNLIQKTVTLARKARLLDVKIMPSLFEMVSGKLKIEELRSVAVEDLLGRKVAHIETNEIEAFLKGKDILITGAAGSIGSELSRQIARFAPQSLHLIDYEESNLFNLARLFEIDYPSLSINTYIADIRNQPKIEPLMAKIKPHICFHAAAYKHVPLMEEFPEEAVATNVFGTLYVAKASAKVGVENFVLISTDKAVRPISIMGKTKRLAEMIVEALDKEGKTKFSSVRFGNVLGSRGSVLPIFQEQLRRRAPLTVTDPRMTRYFMTTPEACLLVLEAAASGEGGEIFALDMGKPVKIVELARELIRLSGLKPDKDIPIVFTKPRPGEKLFENIFSKEEGMVATRYQKIFKIKTANHMDPTALLKEVEQISKYLANPDKLKERLTKLVK
ncbi:MAG: polysaccharide biosynthesis protein [Candidatus Portnoybacteria bacterium]|nr:polysaccharide biosynthesis protein [Candidatus Portnoybacteria bacterium]